MPRYMQHLIEAKLREQLQGGPWEIIDVVANFYNLFDETRLIALRDVQLTRQVATGVIYRSIYNYGSRLNIQQRTGHEVIEDEIERVATAIYVGLLANGEADYICRPVARIAAGRIAARNAMRESNDRQEVAWREQLTQERNKIYQSRTFPSKLRVLIFERDHYTCQSCLNEREKLFALGRHLEVDHRIAWEDGGQTCYENGETLCNVCNIAKHAAKRYTEVGRMLNRVKRSTLDAD